MTLNLLSFIQSGKHSEEPEWTGSFEMWDEEGAPFQDVDGQHRSIQWRISKLNNDFEVIEFKAQGFFTIEQFLAACSASGFEEVTNRKEIFSLIKSGEDLTQLKNILMNITFEREFQGSDFQGSFEDAKGREWLLNFGVFSGYEWLGEDESDVGFGDRDEAGYCEETICFDKITLEMTST